MEEYAPFSEKQRRAINFCQEPGYMYIAQGAIRSGKTYSALLGFFIYTQSITKYKLNIVGGRNLRAMKLEMLPTLQDHANTMGLTHHYDKMDNMWTCNDVKYLFVAGHNYQSEQRIRSLSLGSGFCDEVTLVPEEFFKHLTSRLTYDDSKIWVTCNPGSKRHWFKEGWIDAEKYDLIDTFYMDDNASLGEKVKERNRSLYSGVFKKRMIDAVWCNTDGIIYKEWLDYDRLPTKLAVKRIDIGVDYGVSSITSFVKIITAKDGKRYITDNYQHNGEEDDNKTDEDLASDLMKFVGGDKINTLYYDPTAVSFRNTLRRKKIPFILKAADNEVIGGIRTTMNQFYSGNMKVNKKCKHIIRELDIYSWHEEIPDKPIKENDHHMDAIRYVIYTQDKVAGLGLVRLPSYMQ